MMSDESNNDQQDLDLCALSNNEDFDLQELSALPHNEDCELQIVSAQREDDQVEQDQVSDFKDFEMEDGEVLSEDSSSDGFGTPVCRFYMRNNCFWGNNCRFKHPAALEAPKYDMFDRAQQAPVPLSMYMPIPGEVDVINMPLPLPPTDWVDYPAADAEEDLENSFDTSLQNLKQVMRRAGYTINTPNLRRPVHVPWVQFNDLDTDPYYSRRDEETDQAMKEKSPLPPDCSRAQGQPPAFNRRNSGLRLSRASSTSSSSTPDYTTTTDSNSSSSSDSPVHFALRIKTSTSPRKRKLQLSPKSSAKRTRKSKTPPKNPRQRRARLHSSSSSNSELSSFDSGPRASESDSSLSDNAFNYSSRRSEIRAKYRETVTNHITYTQRLKERLKILERKIAEKTSKRK